jgi:hypothetical protein
MDRRRRRSPFSPIFDNAPDSFPGLVMWHDAFPTSLTEVQATANAVIGWALTSGIASISAGQPDRNGGNTGNGLVETAAGSTQKYISATETDWAQTCPTSFQFWASKPVGGRDYVGIWFGTALWASVSLLDGSITYGAGSGFVTAVTPMNGGYLITVNAVPTSAPDLRIYAGAAATLAAYVGDGRTAVIVDLPSSTVYQKRISLFKDLTLSGVDLAQITPNAQPSLLLDTGAPALLNGYAVPFMKYNATLGKFMASAVGTKTVTDRLHNASENCTYFYAGSVLDFSTAARYLSCNANASVGGAIGFDCRILTTGLISIRVRDGASLILNRSSAAPIAAGSPIVLCYRKRAAATPVASLWLNGSEVLPPLAFTAPAVNATSTLTFSTGPSATGAGGDLHFGNCMYNRELTDSEVFQLSSYWTARMG